MKPILPWIILIENRCGGRADDSSRGQEADFTSAGSAIHTNGVSVLSFAAHHG